MGNNRYLWIAVEADEYELPLAVADHAKDLAALYGIHTNDVYNLAYQQCDGKISGRRFLKIPKEDIEE